jgi:hypothetical protein
MAVNVNPDKYIRKAVYDVTNNIVVSGKTIKTFDSRVTGNANLNEYILMTAQDKAVLKETKCDHEWQSSLLIEIYTRYSSAGNTGSRALLNDIEQEVMDVLNPKLTIQGFTNITQTITYETSLETITDVDVIYRSFLRLNLTLK